MENISLYKLELNESVKSLEAKDETATMEMESGRVIKFASYHNQDCCEHVFADFSILNYHKSKIEGSFVAELEVKGVKDMGFLLCYGREKVFVPCHNYQNGYYGSDLALEIEDNGVKITIDVGECVEESND